MTKAVCRWLPQMPRSRMKQVALLLILVCSFGALALSGLVICDWTYFRRMWGHPANSILDVAWYQPQESVPGGSISPLPRVAMDLDQAVKFDSALELAKSKNAAALLILQNGQIRQESYWQGYRATDWTNSASMAKTITALLIGIAIDEGKIRSLDEKAANWISAWNDVSRKRITLRHLLQMHSGLIPMGEYEELYSDASYLALGTDNRYVVDNVVAVDEPGKRFDYNNVNYQALGFIIEASTNRRYSQYLSEKLWKPIGAADAAMWLDRAGGSVRTFGYLFANASDWARIGQLFLNEGRWDGETVCSHDYLREMLIPSPTNPTYGLGIWLANDDHQRTEREPTFLAPGIFYLDGRFKQRVYVVPTHQIVIVRVGENARKWEESALPNAVLTDLGAR